MKVALIQPFYFNVWESLGLAYIASYCRKDFPGPLEFVFYQGRFDSDDKILSGAKDADVVGFSCTSPTFRHGVSLARALKKSNPRIRTVFGGNHVSALREKIHEEGIDQIVVGEGEAAFLGILNGDTRPIIAGSPKGFRDLPWPDRELINNQRTLALCEKMVGKRTASFQANRGCPFRCTYCAEKSMSGLFHKKTNPIRSRDAKDLVAEIESVASRYAIDSFKFVDATFDTSAEYVIAFCEEKIRRGLQLEWECMIHAGLAQEKMFSWLQKANCAQIDVGCESGSPKILRQMSKGTTTDKVKAVFAWAKECGIKRRAFFLLGMPDETPDDILMTERLAAELAPDVFGATILCPYPGSDLYDHDRMKDVAWEKTDEYSNDFWASKHCSNQELKRWQKHLADKFSDQLAWHHKAMGKTIP